MADSEFWRGLAAPWVDALKMLRRHLLVQAMFAGLVMLIYVAFWLLVGWR